METYSFAIPSGTQLIFKDGNGEICSSKISLRGNHEKGFFLGVEGPLEGTPIGIQFDTANVVFANSAISVYGSGSKVNPGDIVHGDIAAEYRGADPLGYPDISLSRSRGTYDAPEAVLSGDSIGLISFWSSINVSGDYAQSTYIKAEATEDHSDTNQGTELEFYCTANGENVAKERMALEETGLYMYSGVDILPREASTNNVGTFELPFGRVYATHINAVNPVMGVFHADEYASPVTMDIVTQNVPIVSSGTWALTRASDEFTLTSASPFLVTYTGRPACFFITTNITLQGATAGTHSYGSFIQISGNSLSDSAGIGIHTNQTDSFGVVAQTLYPLVSGDTISSTISCKDGAHDVLFLLGTLLIHKLI